MADFANLRKALLCQGEPARVPMVEYAIDKSIKAQFLGREPETMDDEAEFFLGAGYDFVPVLFGMRLTLLERVCRNRRPPSWTTSRWQPSYGTMPASSLTSSTSAPSSV